MSIKKILLIYKGDLQLKKLAILFFSLLIAACSSDNGSDSTQSASVLGTWSHIVPAVSCTETFVFTSNNTFSGTSLDEVFGGTYVFTTQANASNRHAFSFTVTSDNQQFDCEGYNANDIGAVYNLFVEFPSESVMNWYLQSTGGSPAGTLNKQ